MMMVWPVAVQSRSLPGVGGFVVGLAVAWTLVAGLVLGCQGVDYPNLLLDDEGNPVRFNQIDAIVENPDLTEFQKHQALEELGIDDEALRQHYIDTADILQPEEPEI